MRIRNGRAWLLEAALAASAFAQTQVDLRTQGRNADFSNGPVKPFQTGTVLPGTCSRGQAFFKTDAPAGQNIYACTAQDVWSLETPAALPDATGQSGKVLAASGSGAQWTGLAGDISGMVNSTVVGGIQGRPVSSAIPAGGQLLIWNNSTRQWEPGNAPVNYSLPFTSQTNVVIPGSWHGYPTTNLVVDCYDGAENRVEPNSVSIDDATRTVVITFSAPQSGRCVVSGAGAGGASGLPAGAGDGQVLMWNAASGQWVAGVPASSAALLQVTRDSSTLLTIGAACSVASPCNVFIGGAVHSIQVPAHVTLTGGAGTAFIYVDQNGLINVGHNLSITCSTGCQSVAQISGFPVGVIPLAVWTATGGIWDPGGSDSRPWLSVSGVGAGQGIAVSNVAGVSTVAVDPAVVAIYVSGAAVLDFPSIANGACAPELTVAVSGAAPGDEVAAGWPGTLEPGLIGTMRVSAADTVAVRLCNFSGAAQDPASAMFTAKVIRSY